jgi:hypothetical protein
LFEEYLDDDNEQDDNDVESQNDTVSSLLYLFLGKEEDFDLIGLFTITFLARDKR